MLGRKKDWTIILLEPLYTVCSNKALIPQDDESCFARITDSWWVFSVP